MQPLPRGGFQTKTKVTLSLKAFFTPDNKKNARGNQPSWKTTSSSALGGGDSNESSLAVYLFFSELNSRVISAKVKEFKECVSRAQREVGEQQVAPCRGAAGPKLPMNR